jgi:hypothetical protein
MQSPWTDQRADRRGAGSHHPSARTDGILEATTPAAILAEAGRKTRSCNYGCLPVGGSNDLIGMRHGKGRETHATGESKVGIVQPSDLVLTHR